MRQFAAATAAAAAAAADAPFLPLLLQLQQNPSELLLFIRSVLQQLLQALQAAHALNVTHRDVKLVRLEVWVTRTAQAPVEPGTAPGTDKERHKTFRCIAVWLAPADSLSVAAVAVAAVQENVLLQPSLPVSVRLVDWGSAASNDENSPVARGELQRTSFAASVCVHQSFGMGMYHLRYLRAYTAPDRTETHNTR